MRLTVSIVIPAAVVTGSGVRRATGVEWGMAVNHMGQLHSFSGDYLEEYLRSVQDTPDASGYPWGVSVPAEIP
jgi:hypothetical protein